MHLPVLFSSAFLLICSITVTEAAVSADIHRQSAQTDTVIPRKSGTPTTNLSQRDFKPVVLPGIMLDTTFGALPAQSAAVGKAVPNWLRTRVQGKPLYVIDGHSATASQLRSLQQKEVVSTHQLEGQQAQNLYGRHARNGVFIITTKSGLAPK